MAGETSELPGAFRFERWPFFACLPLAVPLSYNLEEDEFRGGGGGIDDEGKGSGDTESDE